MISANLIMVMLGTQNAAKHMGGGGGAYDNPFYLTDLVEDYNGTSFSTDTSLPVGTHYSALVVEHKMLV